MPAKAAGPPGYTLETSAPPVPRNGARASALLVSAANSSTGNAAMRFDVCVDTRGSSRKIAIARTARSAPTRCADKDMARHYTVSCGWRELEAGGLGQAQHKVEILHGCSTCALAEIVQHRSEAHLLPVLVTEHIELHSVGVVQRLWIQLSQFPRFRFRRNFDERSIAIR